MGLENNNPWVGMWMSPRQTIRRILDTNQTGSIIWIAILWGMLSGLAWNGYLWFSYPDEALYRNIFFLLGVLVSGGILGIGYLYLGGWLFKMTGSWLGGSGSFREVKCAVGWSFYPFSVAHLFALLSLAAMPSLWLRSIFGLLNFATAVWGVVIFLQVIGEAHRFSAWKALLAGFMSWVLILVGVMLVSLLVPLLAPVFY